MHALPILKLWEGLNLKWDWESKVKQASVELHSQSTKNFKRYIQLTTNIKIKEAHRKTWKNKWKSANTNKKLKKNSRSATVEIKGQKHQTAEIISVMKYIGNISRLRWQIKKKNSIWVWSSRKCNKYNFSKAICLLLDENLSFVPT